MAQTLWVVPWEAWGEWTPPRSAKPASLDAEVCPVWACEMAVRVITGGLGVRSKNIVVAYMLDSMFLVPRAANSSAGTHGYLS